MSNERTIGSGSGLDEGTWFPGEGQKLEGQKFEGVLTRAFPIPDEERGGKRLAFGFELTADCGPHKAGTTILLSEKVCLRPLRDVMIGTTVRVTFAAKKQKLKGGKAAHQAEIVLVGEDGAGPMAREAARKRLKADELDQELALSGSDAPSF